jgi:hypothetical protein
VYTLPVYHVGIELVHSSSQSAKEGIGKDLTIIESGTNESPVPLFFISNDVQMHLKPVRNEHSLNDEAFHASGMVVEESIWSDVSRGGELKIGNHSS